MSDRTAANSTNGHGSPGDRSGGRQTELSGRENASEHTNDSPERRQEIRQQEVDLNYYRKFLEDLVSVVRDAHSESVSRIISLIRSGASNEEIHVAIQRVQDEI
ncbi:hypothetical protein N7517_007209 [Penicillium concentricum]|uniref:Uncharacterized protein n=1 Tax=Penicillium concentricum TaxID=293559 RepID=A0A9W9VAQ2_9EURO|nr:uncharacterized protein N7517_007209 [Penicillium concentricum]KAJ5375203.1 hypothetical protein N7517_007209 [Penicillium concentricum]